MMMTVITPSSLLKYYLRYLRYGVQYACISALAGQRNVNVLLVRRLKCNHRLYSVQPEPGLLVDASCGQAR